MSRDKSLKSAGALSRHRNVLTRGERIAILTEDGRWEEGTDPFGLPKVAHRKATVGAKDKKEKKAAEGDTPAETPAAAEEKDKGKK